MRSLTKRQMKCLDYLIDRGIGSSDDMTRDQWKRLEGMNDYETLWSDVDRYIHDKVWSRINKQSR